MHTEIREYAIIHSTQAEAYSSMGSDHEFDSFLSASNDSSSDSTSNPPPGSTHEDSETRPPGTTYSNAQLFDEDYDLPVPECKFAQAARYSPMKLRFIDRSTEWRNHLIDKLFNSISAAENDNPPLHLQTIIDNIPLTVDIEPFFESLLNRIIKSSQQYLATFKNGIKSQIYKLKNRAQKLKQKPRNHQRAE